MPSPRIWFVTGASSGLGLDLVQHALSNNDIVVATLRDTSNATLAGITAKYPPDQSLIVQCDVTEYPSVTAAFEKAIAVYGRIDIVVNNAGRGIVCELEGTDLIDARNLFDVNFWGAVNVSREAIRVFREKNGKKEDGKYVGGWLMNQTSMAGLAGIACIGFYSASKHALEGFTETLSLELDPQWNIKVTLLELGFFRTKIVSKATQPPTHVLYDSPSLPTYQTRAYLEGDGINIQGNPYLAAERIYKLGTLYDPSSGEKKDIPSRFILGGDALELIGSKINTLKDDLEMFRTWSDGLNSWE